ncbi:MAG TPA: isocitrate lyase/PEP mutase family protein [Novosphingobium sp.]|nr:isocitrate lyase/PEP mutase family protein [Novosphingobium sp.]
MPTPSQKLRALIEKGEHFIAGEAFSAITGRILEHVGFKAAYLGGHACSAFHYAIPDNGCYSQIEQIEQAGRIAAVMDIPLVSDADTLGETVADAYRLTQMYVRAGVAGYHVEDERNPKHSTSAGGLCTIEEMQLRIEAARKGAVSVNDPDFVIIARCDELYLPSMGGGGEGSLENAIERGKAYAAAGADVITYPLASMDAHAALVAALPVPVCTIGYNVPDTICTLSTGWGWVAAAKGHMAMAKELLETGRVTSDNRFPEKLELIGNPVYDELIRDWADRTGVGSRVNNVS